MSITSSTRVGGIRRGVIYEDHAHQVRRHATEVMTAIKLLFLIHQAEIGLMDQSGGLNRAPIALAPSTERQSDRIHTARGHADG